MIPLLITISISLNQPNIKVASAIGRCVTCHCIATISRLHNRPPIITACSSIRLVPLHNPARVSLNQPNIPASSTIRICASSDCVATITSLNKRIPSIGICSTVGLDKPRRVTGQAKIPLMCSAVCRCLTRYINNHVCAIQVVGECEVFANLVVYVNPTAVIVRRVWSLLALWSGFSSCSCSASCPCGSCSACWSCCACFALWPLWSLFALRSFWTLRPR